MAIEKDKVVAALRDASVEIATLSNDNTALRSENDELLKKVASLELETKDDKVGSKDVHNFLGKEASDAGGNQYIGFGSVGNPDTGEPASATEQMDMILSGEYLG